MPPPPTSSLADCRYLRVADLHRLRHVVFSSRRRVEGLYAGRHATPQRGHSVEFNDYRPYMPGDEMGDVDWKVFGRTDRLFIKLFEHQSEMTVHLVLDASASMAYGGSGRTRSGQVAKWPSGQVRGTTRRTAAHSATRPLGHSATTASPSPRPSALGPRTSKYDHAAMLAGAIAFLATRQQDRVSLALAQSGLAQHLPPAGSFVHLLHMLGAMEAAQPTGEAKLADALRAMAPHAGRRGMVVIISDLLEDQDELLRSMALYSHRGSDLVIFHVLHADELELPDLHDAVFEDSETAGRIRLNVADVRSAYQERMRQFLTGWSTACRTRGIDYTLAPTSKHYVETLQGHLFSRAL